MNGKIKTKFAALFAVALMITVCVVPVVGNEDVQAASAAPEGVSNIKIQMFTEDSTDFSDLIYCANDSKLPASVDPVEWKQVGTTGCFINVNKDSEYFGKFLRFGQTGLSNDEILKLGKDRWLPLIQTSWMYSSGKNVTVSITKPDNNVVADGSPENLVKAEVSYESVEYVSSFSLKDGEGSADLGYTADQLKNLVGKFKVEAKVDTAIIASEEFSYGTVGKQKVTGVVKDKGNVNVIEGAKVAYVVDGQSGVAVTDSNGKYEFYYKKGSVVEITGVTYDSGAYTFDGKYNFGTLDNFKSYGSKDAKIDFVANEMTGQVTIKDLNNTQVISGAGVDLAWYYQFDAKTGAEVAAAGLNTTTSAPSGVTGGKVTALSNVSDDSGIFKYTYVEPTGTPSFEITPGSYKAELIATASGPSGFTYSTANPTSFEFSANKTLSNFANDYGGMAYAKGTSGVINAEQYVLKVKVVSKTNVAIKDVVLESTLYSQKANATNKAKFDISIVSGADVTVLGNTDKDGFAYVAFKKYADKDGVSYFLYTKANNTSNYTFDVQEITTGEGVEKSIAAQVSDNNNDGSTVAAASNTIAQKTLTAKEDAIEVKGDVYVPGVKKDATTEKWPAVTVSYSNGVGNQLILDNATNGTDKYTGYAKYTYSFYVIKGNSSTVSVLIDGFEFKPASYTTPTVSTQVTMPNFVAKSTAVEPEYNEIISIGTVGVNGLDADDVEKVATLVYAVNGKEYTTNVGVTKNAANEYEVSFNVTGVKGSYVQLISAEIEGYDITVEYGIAKVTKLTEVLVTLLNGYDSQNSSDKLTPVANFEMEFVALVDGSENLIQSVGKYKANQFGLIKFYVPSDVKRVAGYIDGEIIDTIRYDVDRWVGIIDMSGYIDEETKVSISYVSAYNSDAVLAEPVEYKAIAPGTELIADIGESIALKAPSIDNFEFVAWMVDGVVVSDKADYTFVVPEHDHDANGACEVFALYSAVHYEEPAEGLSMNVLVIGIVILILGILAVAYGIISKKQ